MACFTHEKIDIIFERIKENLNNDTGDFLDQKYF